MAAQFLISFLLLGSAVALQTNTSQPQMCKDYVGEMACKDAGCRWATVGPAAQNGPTCTRQCHEFGGAVDAGDETTRALCISDAIGCRWIQHPTNEAVGKCGRLCAEFQVESNCQLAGYGSCRYATTDITGGDPKCTKQCAAITTQEWCQSAHCIWTATGTCRRKCIEFQMEGPCTSVGCTWVTPAEGYALSQCIPPTTAPTVAPAFVNKTNLLKATKKH